MSRKSFMSQVDAWADQLDAANAEIERLRAVLESQRLAAVRFEHECEVLRDDRDSVIEECAQVAFEAAGSLEDRKLIAAAIRALKDKTNG